MLLGRVVGRLWAARQAEQPRRDASCCWCGRRPRAAAGSSRLVVAVDGLDAGPGDRVIVAHGSRVRDLTVGAEVADKDVIVGIVDGHRGSTRAMILGRVIGEVWATRRDARLAAGQAAGRAARTGSTSRRFGGRHLVATDEVARRRGRRGGGLPGRAGPLVGRRERHAGRRGRAGRRRSRRLRGGADGVAGGRARHPAARWTSRCRGGRDDPRHGHRPGVGHAQGARARRAEAAPGGGARRRGAPERPAGRRHRHARRAQRART